MWHLSNEERDSFSTDEDADRAEELTRSHMKQYHDKVMETVYGHGDRLYQLTVEMRRSARAATSTHTSLRYAGQREGLVLARQHLGLLVHALRRMGAEIVARKVGELDEEEADHDW